MDELSEYKPDWLDGAMNDIFSTKPKVRAFFYKGIYYNLETGEPSWEEIKALGQELLNIVEKKNQGDTNG